MARASLGGSAASIARDRQAMRGTSRINAPSSTSTYTVQEIQTPSLVVREYLNSSGQVFAVTWNGVHHPDLKSLLGDYYANFDDGDKNTPRRQGGRKHLEVHSGDLTVVRSGHMRSLGGKAVINSLLPEGVTMGSLR